MSKIAMVPVAMIVDGERKVLQPGETVPTSMSKHDQAELTKSRSIGDPVDQALQDRKAVAAQKQGEKAFQQERKNVQAEADSIAAMTDGGTPTTANGKKS